MAAAPPMAAPVTPMRTPVQAPSKAPSKAPTKPPSRSPTKAPTKAPTKPPTRSPTKAPSKAPTKAPTPDVGTLQDDTVQGLELFVNMSWSLVNRHPHAAVGFLGLGRGYKGLCYTNTSSYLDLLRQDHSDKGESIIRIKVGQAFTDGAWNGAATAIAVIGEWSGSSVAVVCDTAALTLSTNFGDSISFNKTWCGNCTKPDVVATLLREVDGKVTITVPK
jgi:hypothetical protein